MRQHTGEKPFKCNQCQKEFTRGESLRFHMNAHKGIRPYCCDVGNCSSNFTKQSSLKRHVKACHMPRPVMVKLEDADSDIVLEDIPFPDILKLVTPAEVERHLMETEFSDGRDGGMVIPAAPEMVLQNMGPNQQQNMAGILSD